MQGHRAGSRVACRLPAACQTRPLHVPARRAQGVSGSRSVPPGTVNPKALIFNKMFSFGNHAALHMRQASSGLSAAATGQGQAASAAGHSAVPTPAVSRHHYAALQGNVRPGGSCPFTVIVTITPVSKHTSCQVFSTQREEAGGKIEIA